MVDAGDALLVTKKGESQSIKNLVEKVKAVEPNLLVQHEFEYRPWGYYINTYEEPEFKTKVITVDPKQQLSYQSHEKRSEVWIVTQGTGEVVLNDDVVAVYVGKVIEVPSGTKHRIRNNTSEVLKFVEVQLGKYFGEDDIIRYQDDYKRI